MEAMLLCYTQSFACSMSFPPSASLRATVHLLIRNLRSLTRHYLVD